MSFSKSPQSIGILGESLVAEYLIEQGYQIIERNFRGYKNREIDIIALAEDKTINFVEVKSMLVEKAFDDYQSRISKSKIFKIKLAAQDYLRNYSSKTIISSEKYKLLAIFVWIGKNNNIERIEIFDI